MATVGALVVQRACFIFMCILHAYSMVDVTETLPSTLRLRGGMHLFNEAMYALDDEVDLPDAYHDENIREQIQKRFHKLVSPSTSGLAVDFPAMQER
ncbi:hypothetical protein GUITHDRAFT_166766 [Guillardia theta CCMP2712]|uniref:Uncharacterized protein n=1 Tax=Guillardia theta (strain CCMP2712) TaxID=905079 RepID=L1I854_GUITC|nr:hypothetical protein GUITHDRAFT_166766 [Guillardia theta CCMP2712]EKX32084.1 hypothetical protein GUITHDRAFT_166766 [Guillardia theta CCMP2712]|eukprot:XP_005819064.1 hypothetical protein GUITHDRAFT_166766 [Guillardia theta CCMP2712]